MKGTKAERQAIERERVENRVTGDDLLKLSEAALQRQLPLHTKFQTGRVTVTHQSIETKKLCASVQQKEEKKKVLSSV